MLTVFFDFNVNVHHEFLPKCQTINKELSKTPGFVAEQFMAFAPR